MFPKTGRKLHSENNDMDLAATVSQALTDELGASHRAVKTVMGWTGASERTIKHWFAATHAPKGDHLILLARNSDQVLEAILTAAGRGDLRIAVKLDAVRVKLLELAAFLDGR